MPTDEPRLPFPSRAPRPVFAVAFAIALGGCAAPSESSQPAGSQRSPALCDWLGQCETVTPIFDGPFCTQDAQCKGDRYCVEQHCFGGVTSGDFGAILDEHTDSVEVDGNRTDLLVDNHRTLAVRRQLVRNADHSVHLSALAIKDDRQGALLVDRLVAAAGRGVEVRVLVDAASHYGTNFGPVRGPGPLRASGYEQLQQLAEAGVRVLTFNPPVKWATLRPGIPGLRLNSRLHEKFLIVDGQDAVIGGRNVGEHYFEREEGWRDIDVHIRGPAVAEMQRIFLQAWDRTGAWERAAGCPNEASYGLYCPPPDSSLAEDPDYYPDVEPVGEARARTIYSAPFLQDPSHGHFTTLSLVRGARRSVTFVNAFFIPPRQLRRQLRLATARGVEVKILKNSKRSQFFNVLYYAGLNYYSELIDAGVEIYEYDGPEMLHAKTMLVDGELAVVGSYNLDPRSAVDHSEAMVLLDDARSVRRLRTATDSLLDDATRATGDISRAERLKAEAHRLILRWL